MIQRLAEGQAQTRQDTIDKAVRESVSSAGVLQNLRSGGAVVPPSGVQFKPEYDDATGELIVPPKYTGPWVCGMVLPNYFDGPPPPDYPEY